MSQTLSYNEGITVILTRGTNPLGLYDDQVGSKFWIQVGSTEIFQTPSAGGPHNKVDKVIT